MASMGEQFEAIVDEIMKANGFVLFRRHFPINRDAVVLFYGKHNQEGTVAVSATGIELVKAEDISVLAKSRAEAAVDTYNQSRRT